MKKPAQAWIVRFLSLLGFSIYCTACSFQADVNEKSALNLWMQDNGRVKVLCTTAMISDLVAEIGGEKVDCLTLIQGDSDPHSYQLVKGDDEKFLRADAIFYNGLGLEHGPSLAQNLINNPKAIGLGDKIREVEPQLILYVDRLPDPHIWMDISIWARAIDPICEALSLKYPAGSPTFRENANNKYIELMQAHETAKTVLASVPEQKRYLVSSHDAFGYFTRQYLATDEEMHSKKWHERCKAPEGLAPESQLSTQDIRRIIDHLSKYQIRVIFPESNVSRDSIRKIVEAGKEKGLSIKIAPVVLYGDAMGSPGSDGDSYVKMILHNAQVIAHELRSSY